MNFHIKNVELIYKERENERKIKKLVLVTTDN